MDIYNVKLGDERILHVHRVKEFFILFATMTPTYFAVEWIFEVVQPSRHGGRDLWRMVFMAIAWSLIMALIFSSRKWKLSVSESWSEYQILVDEKEISTRNFRSHSKLLSRTLHPGQIRTVIEKEKGLLISRHDRFGTFLWGGIWIPRHLPDYEYIKRLISSWGVAGSTQTR